MWPGESSAAPMRVVCGCADTPPPFSFVVCCRVCSAMFSGASLFNGDLSKWEVSGVTSMRCVCVARGKQRGARCVMDCGLR